ncbi:MAG: DUF927 domain-containing protein [Brachymonas sp.]
MPEIATQTLLETAVTPVTAVQANTDAGSTVTGAEKTAVTPVTAAPVIPPLENRPCYLVFDAPVKDAQGKTTHRAGVWHFSTRQGKGGSDPVPVDRWICSPLHVDAVTTDTQEHNYGRLLRFRTTYGTWKTWAMPMAMLAGDGNELRAALLSQGVEIDPEARSNLSRYLQSRAPKKRMRCALQTGWADAEYKAFVLPDVVTGAGAGLVVFQSGEADGNEYTTAGTLDGWRQGVSLQAIDNPVLMLALCAAFAGPLLGRCSAESGGVHFVGDSSTGKTTALEAACSVWGGAGYKRSWRATANGMEGVAAMFNDSLLALDEISECDPRDIGGIVYALGNGRGKQRASRSGMARSVTRWRCCIVSSGERTIETAMQEGGYRVKAGQSVRLLDIPVQRTHGAWDTLHGHVSGNAMSDAIKRAAASHYGHAGRAFLERLTRHHDESFGDALADILNLPAFAAEGDGQVKRAASRFALLALAGELATGYGVTGWQAGAATAAAADLFTAWKQQRGSTGANMEQAQIKAAVLGFIEQHGASRFQDVDKPEAIVHNRAGWREVSNVGTRYLFTTSGMKEALRGFDTGRAKDILIQCGALPQPGADGRRDRAQRIHGELIRVSPINPDALRGADHGIA